MGNILVGVNDVFLKYEKLITNINDDIFCQNQQNSSSIGAHVRHVLDRAHCVVAGFKTKIINYDNRRRDIKLENNKELALDELKRILDQIQKFSQDLNQEVEIIESVNEEGAKAQLKSNFGREFHDITIHMIHHLATIKFLLEKSGIKVDKNFGKNYSTVIHENN